MGVRWIHGQCPALYRRWTAYLTVLLGIFLNQRAIDRLENSLGSRIDRLEARMDKFEARLDRLEADLREFYRTLGQHDARIDGLEKRRA